MADGTEVIGSTVLTPEVNDEENGDEDEEENLPRGMKLIRANTDIKVEGGPPRERKCSFNFMVGADLDHSIEVYGKELVHENFVAQIVVKAKQRARRELGTDKSQEDVEKFMETWKPVLGQPRGIRPMSPASVLNYFENNTEKFDEASIDALMALINKQFPGKFPSAVVTQQNSDVGMSSAPTPQVEPELAGRRRNPAVR